MEKTGILLLIAPIESDIIVQEGVMHDQCSLLYRIVMKTKNKVVFHSKNFCPTLEACKILGLDTRMICKNVNEKPTDALVKQLNNKLEFVRNYEKLRPYCDYCEEMVLLKEAD